MKKKNALKRSQEGRDREHKRADLFTDGVIKQKYRKI